MPEESDEMPKSPDSTKHDEHKDETLDVDRMATQVLDRSQRIYKEAQGI